MNKETKKLNQVSCLFYANQFKLISFKFIWRKSWLKGLVLSNAQCLPHFLKAHKVLVKKIFFQMWRMQQLWIWRQIQNLQKCCWKGNVSRTIISVIQLFCIWIGEYLHRASKSDRLNLIWKKFHQVKSWWKPFVYQVKQFTSDDKQPPKVFHRKSCSTSGLQLYWKETPTQVVSSEIWEIFKSICFEEHLWTTVCVGYLSTISEELFLP